MLDLIILMAQSKLKTHGRKSLLNKVEPKKFYLNLLRMSKPKAAKLATMQLLLKLSKKLRQKNPGWILNQPMR